MARVDNETLFNALEAGNLEAGREKSGSETIIKFLLFHLGERCCAIAAEEVREILIAQDVYALPFVPDWMPGLLNYHGEPSAVVDLKMLIEESGPATGGKIIVLKEGGGQLSLRVDEVSSIVKVSATTVSAYPEPEGGGYFSRMVIHEGCEYPVLSLHRVHSVVAERTGSGE